MATSTQSKPTPKTPRPDKPRVYRERSDKIPASYESRIFKAVRALHMQLWVKIRPKYVAMFRQALGQHATQKQLKSPIKVMVSNSVDDPLVKRFLIDILGMFDGSARKARIDLGQRDASSWEIRSQSVYDQIMRHEIKLAQSTLEDMAATTEAEAQRLIGEMQQQILERQKAGKTLGDLTDRLAKFFGDESRWKARRIAATESARAHNYGLLAGTADMDVCVGYEWVMSTDACPECYRVGQVNGRPRMVKKGSAFATGQSKDDYYATVMAPPLHPHCRCSIAPVVDLEEPEKWDSTVEGK